MVNAAHRFQAFDCPGRHLIEKRFGPISPVLRERIMAADPVAVEQWLDRVIDAPDLATVFDKPN